MKMKVAQSCRILCDHMDYTVHEIIQARILEWVAHPFSCGSSQSGTEPRSPTDSLSAEPRGKPILLANESSTYYIITAGESKQNEEKN